MEDLKKHEQHPLVEIIEENKPDTRNEYEFWILRGLK